jgi:hypothetical protein
MGNALKETLKSFLRGLYFAVLGVVGTSIASLATDESLVNSVVNIGDVYVPVGVGIAAALGFLAKMIDRYIHTNDNIKLNGITPADLLER